MDELLQWLYQAAAWIFNGLWLIGKYFLDGILYIIKGVLWLMVSGIMQGFQTAFDALSFTSVVFQWAAAYTSIPQQAVYVMVRIGFPEFVTMIGAAYVIRLTMNVIPAALTRV